MPATAPPSITALPSPPDPNDRSTYNSLAHPWSVAQQTMATQIGAVASNVYANTQAAEAAMAAADADATAVAADKVAAAASATTATTQRGLADTAAATATAQAGVATTQRGLADTAAATATTQQGLATTAAASASAITLGVASGHPAARPTLNLNFASARTLDPRITFTRASTATRTNPRGIIESVASGAPRFDHDPITLACRGLLIEESRTNLLLRSEEFDNAAWTKSNATITANATVSPDGTADADKLVETAANGTHIALQSQSGTPTNTHTFSVYAKSSERSRISLQLDAGGAAGGSANFDLVSGVVDAPTGSGSPSATITPVGGGWYRCTLTAVPAASGATVRGVLYLIQSGGVTSYTGDGTSGLFLWGAQLEAGAFPTSYIPTTTATATRAADVAAMTGINFSSWYRQDEGTFVTEFSCITSNPTGFWRVLSANVADNVNEIAVLLNPITDKVYAAVSSAGSASFDTGGAANGNAAVSANTLIKAALAYKLNDFACSMNGGAAQTDSTGNTPVGLLQLRIGNFTGSDQLNGHIRSLRYYPARLTNAQLQTLTQD